MFVTEENKCMGKHNKDSANKNAPDNVNFENKILMLTKSEKAEY